MDRVKHMNVDLKEIKGVGDKLTQIFRKEGLWNTYDLISYYPRGYDNFYVSKYEDLKHNEVSTVIGKIIDKPTTFKRKVSITSTTLDVDGHQIRLVIFGRDYIEKQIELGDLCLVKGQFNLLKNEMNVSVITKKVDQSEIKPLYKIKGIPDANISKIIDEIITNNQVDIYETLPIELLKKHFLYSRKRALLELHKPESLPILEKAIRRFKMEEAFIEQLKYFYKMDPKTKRDARAYQIKDIKHKIDELPFQLTLDQQEAVNDIYKDFKKNETMYRLLQGDVGSGKTMVSFLAALGMISSGYQVAMMAPTELLAKQHYENFTQYFKDVPTTLLTSSTDQKESVKENIKNGQVKMIIGTHSLASDDVIFNQLGMAIIDEQHKFGVDVRHQLINKGHAVDVLYLTATPIPRSLFMTYFGDLDVSSIHMKPAERRIVETVLLSDKDQLKVLEIVKDRQAKYEQTFIIVPAILTKKKKYTIETVLGLLEATLDPSHIFVIHGKLNPNDVNKVMEAFISDKQGILLSTTMIEVGIDVKNATTMVIFGAEHFGLSQLHQLRGRIGRGKLGGTCYLLSGKEDVERLNLLENINDGFVLSEYDLKLRGPGIFSDFVQTGKIQLNFLDLTVDQEIIHSMKDDAKYYAKNIEAYPYLKKRIS